jgi:hypothetical protein
MDRRSLIAGAASAAAVAAAAKAQDSSGPAVSQTPLPPPGPAPAASPPPEPAPAPPPAPSSSGQALPEAPPAPEVRPSYPATTPAQAYDRSEIVNGVSDFLGVSAESAGAAVERIFKEKGRPTAYIAGEEGGGAFFGGVRYGKGLLYMKGRQPVQVYWQGPSVGFDWGANASRSFTLCYNLQFPEMIYRRFPGVEGSAYFIAGLGVNYQRADEVTLAPIRTGVGLRLGANVGYLSYSRKRHLLPL